MNKKNYIVKETYTVNNLMKQELIEYLSVGSMKIVEQEPEDGASYLVAYTTICSDTKPFTILKNNQFVEPFNHYYQNLLTSSDKITDVNLFFLPKKIEELHLSYKDIAYLEYKYPQIKTVEDFSKAKYYYIDPHMEYIRNILMTFEAITSLVIKIKKDRQISENIKLESNMSEKTKTMASRLRKNQEKNQNDYQRRNETSAERVQKIEQLAKTNFQETTEFRKKNLKAKQEYEEIDPALQEFIRENIQALTIEEQDRLLAQEFISSSVLTKDEFDPLYWQARIIHHSIAFDTLRKIFNNNKESKYHDFWMEINDDKDGIYKHVQISPEHMTTSIEQCKNLNNGYCISEKIDIWNDYEIYFSRTLLKTNYPKNEEFIPLAHKKWLYTGTIKEIENENYTDLNLEDLQALEGTQKDKKKQYIKCLSKNK